MVWRSSGKGLTPLPAAFNPPSDQDFRHQDHAEIADAHRDAVGPDLTALIPGRLLLTGAVAIRSK